ncbi:MAG: hypothetical protein V7784_14320, partial [Oceanospirillaceae bacterium]
VNFFVTCDYALSPPYHCRQLLRFEQNYWPLVNAIHGVLALRNILLLRFNNFTQSCGGNTRD